MKTLYTDQRSRSPHISHSTVCHKVILMSDYSLDIFCRSLHLHLTSNTIPHTWKQKIYDIFETRQITLSGRGIKLDVPYTVEIIFIKTMYLQVFV